MVGDDPCGTPDTLLSFTGFSLTEGRVDGDRVDAATGTTALAGGVATDEPE